MSKKSNNKIIKNIILFIILILVCILIFLLNPKNMIKAKLAEINEKGDLNSKIALPKNMHVVFDKYTGNVSLDVAVKSFDFLAKDMIPKYYKICKNMSTDELVEYYNKKAELIAMEIGCNSEKDFVNLMNALIKLDGKKIVFTEYKIVRGTITYNNNKSMGNIIITYNGDQKLYLKFVVKDANFTYMQPIEIFAEENVESIIQKVEENKKKDEEKVENIVRGTGRVLN